MRVGVILAARAPVPWLGEALDSVCSQATEVVLVDHASEPALSAPDGVRLMRIDHPDGGPAAARQAGLESLDCDWIALADADDVWEPGKLDAQLEALREHPDAAVCFGRAVVIDEQGRGTGERLPGLTPGVHVGDELVRELYVRNVVPAASALVRRDALDAVGGFVPPEPLPAASDWDLWLRLAAGGYAFVCEPRAQVRYRRHPGGLTSSVSGLAQAGLLIHNRYAELVPGELATHAKAADLRALARGRIRERRYAEARTALTEAKTLTPPASRDKLLKAALIVPGLRTVLGRRNPYR